MERSLAFTALLEIYPGFGKMEDFTAGRLITRFLREYHEAGGPGQGTLFDYVRTWHLTLLAEDVAAMSSRTLATRLSNIASGDLIRLEGISRSIATPFTDVRDAILIEAARRLAAM